MPNLGAVPVAPGPAKRGPLVAQGPVSLVIGVAGHRHLIDEDLPLLEAGVRETLRDLRARFPSTPLALLSPLGEGADRLAARVALDCGVRLIALLPWPLESYREAGSTGSSRAELEDLLARAAASFNLASAPEERVADDAERDRLYARARAWIAQQSQLLLALWDGVPSDRDGATGQTVRFRLEGLPEGYGVPRSPLDAVETGPVAHLLAPRQAGGERPRPAPMVRFLYPKTDDPKHDATVFEGMWTRIDRFNRDARRLVGPSSPEVGEPLKLPGERGTPAPETMRRLIEAQVAADELAMRFQARTRRTLKAVLLLAVLAALVSSCPFSQRLPTRLSGALYVAFLGTAYGCYLWAKRAEYQKRFLDYRALAEGLRVQIFWQLAGLEGSVADHYLRKQRSELDWIRQVMRSLYILSPRGNERTARQAVETVLEAWVEDQGRYYARAAPRDERMDRTIRRVGHVSFLVGLGLVVLKFFLIASDPLVAAVGLAPLLGAVVLIYADRMAFAQHAKQYARMAQLFANARKTLGRSLAAGDVAQAQNLLQDLGREALAENADWLLLHRDRPVNVPGLKLPV